MAEFLWVVNRMDQGYGVDIPLNAKKKKRAYLQNIEGVAYCC